MLVYNDPCTGCYTTLLAVCMFLLSPSIRWTVWAEYALIKGHLWYSESYDPVVVWRCSIAVGLCCSIDSFRGEWCPVIRPHIIHCSLPKPHDHGVIYTVIILTLVIAIAVAAYALTRQLISERNVYLGY